jgi:hypothetical protein
MAAQVSKPLFILIALFTIIAIFIPFYFFALALSD